MLNLKIISLISFLLIAVLASSCIYPKLGRESHSSENIISTANNTFMRDSYQEFVLLDSLRMDQEEDLTGLPTSTFLQYAGNLVFTTMNGYLYFCKLDNIEKFTKKQLTIGIEAAPTVSDSILFIPVIKGDNGLIVYDMVEGSILWSLEGKFSKSSPVVFNNSVIHAAQNGTIYSLNIKTSKKNWTLQLDANIENSLALFGNNLVVAAQNGIIRNYNPENGTMNWSQKTNGAIYASPVTDGKVIFIANYYGDIIKMDLLTGDIKSSIKNNAPVYLPPAMDKEHIYVPLSDGKLIKLNKSNFTRVWTTDLQAPFSASPLISENKIITGTFSKKLYVLDKENGAILQKIKLGGRLKTQPSFYNNRIYISHEPTILLTFTTKELNE